MNSNWILIISEYDLACWKKIGHDTRVFGEEPLIYHLPKATPEYVYVPDIISEGCDSIDDYLRQRKEALIQETEESKRIFDTVAEILKDDNIDWSLDDGGRDTQYGVIANIDAWHLWLEKGRGKVFRVAPLPPSAFIDVYHFRDFIFEGGDCYVMEPFEESSLTNEQALKMLLVLEIDISSKGLCWFYRALREHFGIPYDWDTETFSLDVETILQIAESTRSQLKQRT